MGIAITFTRVSFPNEPWYFEAIFFGVFLTLGATLFVLGSLSITAEFRYRYYSRRIPRLARQKDIADWLKEFDRLFAVFDTAKPDIRERIVGEFSAVLINFVNKPYLRTKESRERISKLFDDISTKILTAGFLDKNRYLSWLRMFDAKDSQTYRVMKEKFSGLVNTLYDDPNLELNADVLLLRQMFNDYNKTIIDQLVNDAIDK